MLLDVHNGATYHTQTAFISLSFRIHTILKNPWPLSPFLLFIKIASVDQEVLSSRGVCLKQLLRTGFLNLVIV